MVLTAIYIVLFALPRGTGFSLLIMVWTMSLQLVDFAFFVSFRPITPVSSVSFPVCFFQFPLFESYCFPFSFSQTRSYFSYAKDRSSQIFIYTFAELKQKKDETRQEIIVSYNRSGTPAEHTFFPAFLKASGDKHFAGVTHIPNKSILLDKFYWTEPLKSSYSSFRSNVTFGDYLTRQKYSYVDTQ